MEKKDFRRNLFSLLTAFFLFNIGMSARSQNPGDQFFSAPIIHEMRMTFWQPDFWDSLTANYTTETYMRGLVQIDGVSHDTIGIKFKGNSSYNNPSDKKPFKLDFNLYNNAGQIDGLKKLNLNNVFKDPSFLREKVSLDFYNQAGIAAPRCSYANVYINGALWGLYTVVEEVDKTFLNSRFNDNDGNLFKGDPSGDLKWLGSNPTVYYNKYELQTNETQNNWSDLVDLLNIINNSGPLFRDRIDSVLDVNGFLRAWAATSLFSNLDSYIGSGHNYFLYHDSTLKKFRYILWDVNESFGNFTMGLNAYALNNLAYDYINNPPSRPLCNNLKLDNLYHQQLAIAMCELVESGFGLAEMESAIDSLANAIRPHVYADPKKTYSNQQFENNLINDIQINSPMGFNTILGIKSFLQLKKNSLTQQLSGVTCSGTGLNSGTPNGFRIYPNPGNAIFHIEYPDNNSHSLQIIDATGRGFETFGVNENRTLDLSNYATGIYSIKDESGHVVRLIKTGK